MVLYSPIPMTELDDVKIQIEAVTRQSLCELREKFPGKSFDLMLRDFSPAIYLQIGEIQLSQVVRRTLKGPVVDTIKKSLQELVFEDFCLASPTFHFHNGERKDYENNIAFFKELRNIPVLKELISEAGYDKLIPWITSKDDHDSFFRKLNSKYPSIFSYFGYEKTVKELREILMAAIERRYRSDEIDHHILDRKGIEDKLEGVYDWHKNRSEAWFKNIHEVMKDLYIPGFQRITLTEIVPLGLSDYFGPIGGKTIKFGHFNDFNKEFVMSQHDALGNDINKLDPELLAGLRDLFLPMLISRRFIFPEAIDSIIEFQEKKTGKKYGSARNDLDFRAMAFNLFFDYSKGLYDKIYLAYNLRSLE